MNNILDAYQKIYKVENTVIYHPEFQNAYNTIKRAIELRRTVGLQRNFFCIGQTGTGKTTLKDKIESQYPSESLEDRELTPVFCVDIPSTPTKKSVAEAILYKLGEPAYTKGSATEKTARVVDLFKEKRVELVIFDEVQHIFDQGNKNTPNEVSDWLKEVIKESKASTVLMGLPRSKKLLAVNDQLRRRFSSQVELSPFSLQTSEDANVFAGVIQHFEKLLELPEPMKLQKDLLKRFHYATNGIIDYIVKILCAAFEIIIVSGECSFTTKILEQAFTISVWHEGSGKLNPFNKSFGWQRLDKPGMPFCQLEGRKQLRIPA